MRNDANFKYDNENTHKQYKHPNKYYRTYTANTNNQKKSTKTHSATLHYVFTQHFLQFQMIYLVVPSEICNLQCNMTHIVLCEIKRPLFPICLATRIHLHTFAIM